MQRRNPPVAGLLDAATPPPADTAWRGLLEAAWRGPEAVAPKRKKRPATGAAAGLALMERAASKAPNIAPRKSADIAPPKAEVHRLDYRKGAGFKPVRLTRPLALRGIMDATAG